MFVTIWSFRPLYSADAKDRGWILSPATDASVLRLCNSCILLVFFFMVRRPGPWPWLPRRLRCSWSLGFWAKLDRVRHQQRRIEPPLSYAVRTRRHRFFGADPPRIIRGHHHWPVHNRPDNELEEETGPRRSILAWRQHVGAYRIEQKRTAWREIVETGNRSSQSIHLF